MPHTISPVAPVVLTSIEPGTSAQFVFAIFDAYQPAASSVSGSVSVEFDGNTATAPLTVQFDTGPTVPAVAVDLGGGSNLEASVDSIIDDGGGRWTVTGTIAVV